MSNLRCFLIWWILVIGPNQPKYLRFHQIPNGPNHERQLRIEVANLNLLVKIIKYTVKKMKCKAYGAYFEVVCVKFLFCCTGYITTIKTYLLDFQETDNLEML